MFDTCRTCYDTGATDENYTPCTRCTRGQAVANVNEALKRIEPTSLSQAQRERRACVVCARRLPKTDRPVALPGGAWAGACNPCCGANTAENELLPAAATEDDDLTPDPVLVRRVASRVKAHLGRRTGKAMFAHIEAAIHSDPDLAAELAGLDDGARELLLDDVQTEIG